MKRSSDNNKDNVIVKRKKISLLTIKCVWCLDNDIVLNGRCNIYCNKSCDVNCNNAVCNHCLDCQCEIFLLYIKNEYNIKRRMLTLSMYGRLVGMYKIKSDVFANESFYQTFDKGIKDKKFFDFGCCYLSMEIVTSNELINYWMVYNKYRDDGRILSNGIIKLNTFNEYILNVIDF
jgi:hypothetical protein